MNSNILPSNRAVLAGVIDPDNYAGTTVTTGWVSLKDFGSILALIAWGDLGAGGTVNAKLEQSSDESPMATVKDVTGKAITEVDSTDSPEPHNKQALINCRADELDVANGYNLVRLSITSALGSPEVNSDLFGCVFGLDARYAPETDATSVAEVVS